MNKKNLTIIILLAVIVIVILGVVIFNHRAKAPQVPAVTTSTSANGNTIATTSTVSAISVTVSTSTTNTYAGSSFSFKYPSSWTIFSESPLLITSFSNKDKTGGVIPAGGAQITIVTTTTSGNVDEIMATELANAINLNTSAVTVDGTVCAKAVYQVNYAPGATVQNMSVYCSQGNELWKIYFSYPANDPAGNMDVSQFNAILGSMKLSG